MNRFSLHVFTVLVAAACLAACDANSLEDAPGAAATVADDSASLGGQPSLLSTSPIDGRPIVYLNASDLAGDAFGQTIRAAIVDRGAGTEAALAASLGLSDDALLLKDVLAGVASATGTALPSTHLVIVDGGQQEFLLTAEYKKGAGAETSGGSTFVILNPEVFAPDSDPDGKSTVRTFPATKLSTGEQYIVTASGGAATAVPKFSTNALPEPVRNVILVDVVSILDASTTTLLPKEKGLDSFNNAGFFGTHPFVGVRRLRVDEKHDGGPYPWSEKQEVQLTAEVGDTYSVPFKRNNTRRFDKAFWTNITSWPFFPPSGVGTQSTFNPVLSNTIPVAGGTRIAQTVWFFAQDVDYANQDYVFGQQRYQFCDYLVTGSCTPSQASYDFPLTFLQSSTPKQRSYLNEDDWNVDQFSRRSGRDWQGNIQTYNFGTGTTSSVSTKVDAANHAITTDDRVFVRSGLRGMTQATVQSRAGTSGATINVGGLRWELSYGVLNVAS